MQDPTTTPAPGTSPDPFEQALLDQGTEPGQRRLPTPQDIIAFETGQKAKPPATKEEDQPPAPDTTGDDKLPDGQTAFPDDKALDALVAKSERGEQLTEDEQLVLAKMIEINDAPPEPPSADDTAIDTKTFNIGGQVLTGAQLWDKVRAEYKLNDLKIAPGPREKMIETYVKAQNRTEFSRTLQKSSEEIAHTRQQQAIARLRLDQEQAAIKRQRENLARREEELRERAAVKLTKDDLTDNNGVQDPDKVYEYNEARRAREELVRLDKSKEGLAAQEEEIAQRIVRTAVADFIEEHPQYKTKGDVFETWNQYREGKPIDPEDELKVLELDDLVSASMSKKLPVERIFALKKAQHTLAVAEPVQAGHVQSSAPPLPEPGKTANSFSEILRNFRKKVAANPSLLPGGGTGRRERQAPSPDSTRIIRRDQATLGSERDDFLNKELGYR
jgi:hypothetical protein